MPWSGWIVVVFMTLNAGWMVFDGTRALTVGDYVTPQTGEYAGQLGPWAKLVDSIGIEPRSTAMKFIFIGYGLAVFIIAVCFALKLTWAWWAMFVIAILGLWYLPTGTVVSIIVLVLLLLPSLRQMHRFENARQSE